MSTLGSEFGPSINLGGSLNALSISPDGGFCVVAGREGNHTVVDAFYYNIEQKITKFDTH